MCIKLVLTHLLIYDSVLMCINLDRKVIENCFTFYVYEASLWLFYQ